MSTESPRIIYLTAGAAGMFCGSCMHDNALAKALSRRGWDIQLVPTYTPIRTDEADFSVDHVLFGGVNVFLQQKLPLFRLLPAFVDRVLDRPSLIRRVTARAAETDAKTLGSLAVSMLKGTEGNQRKEVMRMCKWLKREQPDLLIFTNILIGGCIKQIKRDLNVPVLVTLQGDDVFLDSLEEPYRSRCMDQIRGIIKDVDGFIVHSQFFKEYMTSYFELEPDRIHVTPLGIDTADFPERLAGDGGADGTRTIGYMARLAPEKGLHNLVESFVQLKTDPKFQDVKLKVAGWLGPQHESYADQQWQKLESSGLLGAFEYLGSIDRKEKLDFLGGLSVLCVPTDFLEPKGLYVLEAFAAGVPVVQPDHGAFPELIQASGGGLLYPAGSTEGLTEALRQILSDAQHQQRLAVAAHQYVHQQRNSVSMAVATEDVIAKFLDR